LNPIELQDRPLLRAQLAEEKEKIKIRNRFRVEQISVIRKAIGAQNFIGNPIEVSSSSETDQIIIKTKDASFFVDLYYSEDGEIADSLRKDSIYSPYIVLSSKVGNIYHTIIDGSIEEC
jgi:ABC-type uncharacterized transport system substrate-binding protein